MSLRDAMRKAAGLLVEMPAGEYQPAEGEAEQAGPAPDIGELLSVLESGKTPGGKTAGAPVAGGAKTAQTVEQIVAKSPGPNLDQIKAPPSVNAVAPDGSFDFAAVYQGAKLPATPFSAEQMLDMLASLPAELPLDTRRQTVKVTLGAMGKSLGATPETIVTDASRKLASLHAYVEGLEHQTSELATTSGAEIAALQARIEEKRRAIEAAHERLAQATAKCVAESDRLDDVLEFFSLDVAPSKYAAEEEKRK